MKKCFQSLKRSKDKKDKSRSIGKLSKFENLLNKLIKKSPTISINISKNAYNKKAILIGLNYFGSHFQLKGCINDIKNGAEYLKKHNYDVKLLTDKDVSKKYNVLEALNELKQSENKIVFFHYSGHGSQTVDLDKDEEDGYDEVVYSNGDVRVTDDQINDLLKTFPEDKTVFLVFDCCHSGNITDLPFTLGDVDNDAKSDKMKEESSKKLLDAKILCIGGCRDSQTSADVSNGGISYGALSASLYSILRKREDIQSRYPKNDLRITWRQLYDELLSDMRIKGYSQVPSISASDPQLFDTLIDF